MVVKLRNQVENKVLAAKHHSGEKEVENASSNLNLIKRYWYHYLKLILVAGRDEAFSFMVTLCPVTIS